MNLPIRYIKILLVFLTGLWAATSLFTNLGALDKTYDALELVSSMRELGDQAPPWKTSAPGVIWFGVVCLLGGKLITALLSCLGARSMWKARSADAAAFQASKTLAILGGWSAIAWLFVGFAYFGEIIFFMYLGETGFNVSETAFRYAGYIALMTLFVGQKDE